MQIDYNDKELRRNLLTKSKLRKKYGKHLTKQITDCQTHLETVENLGQVTTGKPFYLHPLERERTGQYAISLDNKARLILKPSHIPIPTRDGEEMDLKRLKSVTEITILEILPYHNY